MFDGWVHKCKGVEEKLQNLGETSVKDNVDTVDGAKTCIEEQEVNSCSFLRHCKLPSYNMPLLEKYM